MVIVMYLKFTLCLFVHYQQGRYEYKYIVDGVWTCSELEPLTSPNSDGHVNNYVQVRLLSKDFSFFLSFFFWIKNIYLRWTIFRGFLFLQVFSNDSSAETRELRSRLMAEDVDLTKVERLMVREYLEQLQWVTKG